MAEFLLIVVLFCVSSVGACVAAFLLFVHALSVRNRIVPGRRSPAPLTWLTSPEAAARLHRRLRAAMAAASAVDQGHAGNDLGLGDVVAELQQRAMELDGQLVFASRSPRNAKRRMLRELHSEIAEVELLVQRTVRMSRAWAGSAPSERGLGPVRERLELLESALRELDGLEIGQRAPEDLPARRYRQA